MTCAKLILLLQEQHETQGVSVVLCALGLRLRAFTLSDLRLSCKAFFVIAGWVTHIAPVHGGAWQMLVVLLAAAAALGWTSFLKELLCTARRPSLMPASACLRRYGAAALAASKPGRPLLVRSSRFSALPCHHEA